MILKDPYFRRNNVHIQFLRTANLPVTSPVILPKINTAIINCMKARARFLFPIPFPFLPQYHVLPFSFHILEYFSKHTEDRKAAWNFKFLTGQTIDRKGIPSLISCGKIVVFQAGPARRPFGLVAREKNLPHALRERIFHGKPCRRPPKTNWRKHKK